MQTEQLPHPSVNRTKDFLLMVLFIFICQAVGIAASTVTLPEIPTWYAGLVRPEYSPPNWVFGPVWTSLYALMGISAYIIYKHKDEKPEAVKIGLGLFAIQLVLNGLWSVIFFNLHNLLLASIEVVLLDLAVLACIIWFKKINRLASMLLWPYMAWISFATYLTISFYLLNP